MTHVGTIASSDDQTTIQHKLHVTYKLLEIIK